MPVARAVAVHHLPAGRAVAAMERDGEFLVLIAEDRPADEVAQQLTEVMQNNLTVEAWTQNWGGPGAPEPPRMRAVS